jgi:hypothetical protein
VEDNLLRCGFKKVAANMMILFEKYGVKVKSKTNTGDLFEWKWCSLIITK